MATLARLQKVIPVDLRLGVLGAFHVVHPVAVVTYWLIAGQVRRLTLKEDNRGAVEVGYVGLERSCVVRGSSCVCTPWQSVQVGTSGLPASTKALPWMLSRYSLQISK